MSVPSNVFSHVPDLAFQVMVISAIVLSLAALFPIKRIYSMLPVGATRMVWALLAVLIVVSTVGYGVFLRINSTEGPDHREDWLVAAMFLAASLFVSIVAVLSLRTAEVVAHMGALELAATIDPVTELYNRRHIMTALENECFMARKDRSPLSILIIDIDGFKRINDTYGHPVGDYILRELGQLLASGLAESRLIGRYGGEEFLVILSGTTAASAAVIAERLRALVEQTAIAYDNEPILTPTISVGVATAFGWHESAEELISIADEALYAAKATGRNRVCHAFERSGKRAIGKMAFISPLHE